MGERCDDTRDLRPSIDAGSGNITRANPSGCLVYQQIVVIVGDAVKRRQIESLPSLCRVASQEAYLVAKSQANHLECLLDLDVPRTDLPITLPMPLMPADGYHASMP